LQVDKCDIYSDQRLRAIHFLMYLYSCMY